MKINKNNFVWIFIVSILALLLALSVYLGVSGWYFQTENSYTADMQIGTNMQIDISDNMANSASINIDGAFLYNQEIPQTISVKNIGEDDIFVRAKIFIYASNSETKKIDISETINWFENEDGYFYFNNLLKSGEKVSLCSSIIVPEDSNLDTNKKYILTILFEGLNKNQDAETFWGINPVENV